MNQVPQLSAVENSYFPGDGDIFFRADDKAIRDRLCAQMVDDGMSLAIIGANDACVDHYCRMLVKRLRAVPEILLEVHSPTNTEELLDRFNEILASLSTAEAMDRRNPLAPLRILILGKADTINPAGGRLLARLVNSFPGANTQLILLQSDSSQEKLMDLFGRRLLRWSVPLPSRADALAMLAAARPVERENDVIKLLQKVNPHLLEQPLWEATLTDDVAESVPAEPEPEMELLPEEDAPEDQARTGRSLLSTVLLTTVTVALAAIVVALLFPRQAEVLRSALAPEHSTAAVPPAASPPQAPAVVQSAPSPPAPVTPLDSSAAVPTPAAAAPGDSATLERVNIGRSPRELPADAPRRTPAAASAAAPVAASAAAPLAPSAAAPVVPAAAAPVAASTTPSGSTRPAVPSSAQNTAPAKAIPVAKADVPAAAIPRKAAPSPQSGTATPLQAAIQKVRSTPEQHIFVQHIALDSYAEAREWQKEEPALAKSLIAPVHVDSGHKLKYVVVSGPFSSQAAASAFSQRKDIPAKPWLRTAVSLAKALAQDN